MVAHQLVFLGDLGFEEAGFIQLLGLAKQNPFEREYLIDGKSCTIHVHEVVGPDEATEGLIRSAEGVVYFYNVALRPPYERIRAIHDKIQEIKAASTSSAQDPAISSAVSPPTFQRVLVGTVLVGTEREVSRKEGNELARILECDFFEVSEGAETTVENMLHLLIRLCRQARKAEGDKLGDSRWNWRSCFGWR